MDAAARELIKEKGTRKVEREGFTHRLGELLYALRWSAVGFDVLSAQGMELE